MNPLPHESKWLAPGRWWPCTWASPSVFLGGAGNRSSDCVGLAFDVPMQGEGGSHCPGFGIVRARMSGGGGGGTGGPGGLPGGATALGGSPTIIPTGIPGQRTGLTFKPWLYDSLPESRKTGTGPASKLVRT